MGKRGRVEDKGKGEDDDLIGVLKSRCHIHTNVVCLIEDRLLGSCLCSAESTSVVAASAVGVLGAFAPEVEMAEGCFFPLISYLSLFSSLGASFFR
jgi:hypothetical protein